MINNLIGFTIALTLISNFSRANEIPPPACPTIQMSGTNVSCYGVSDGTATVGIVSGGSTYSYTWSSGENTTSIAGKPVGTYTVNVKDDVSGCTVIGAYVVSQPDPIIISNATLTNINCNGGANGAVDITALGGTPGYTYAWSNGATTEDVSGLTSGTYSVVITDTRFCTLSQSYTLTQPAQALNGNGVVTNVSCFSGSNGSISVSTWGGTPPYTYSWDSGQSSEDISSITAGSYVLTVTDSKSCTNILPFNVTQPTSITGTMSSTNVLCYGQSTGSVSISASGGTPPYSYSWQNATTLFAQNTATLSNVPAGNYQVTVTDSKGCQFVSSVAVAQPSLLTGSTVGTNISCNGGTDGAVDLTVGGGVAPYSYNWTNSVPSLVSTNQDLTAVPAEVYTVVVTDFNNCTLSLTQELTEPLTPVSASFVVTHVLCYGNSTGAIDLTISGGTSPYTYSWSSGQTTQDISFLTAGTYGFSSIDAQGCPISGVAIVTQPAQPLTLTSVITDVNCFGESNGIIDLTVTGGTAPYYYDWSNSTYLLSNTNQDLINYPADDYRYEVTDANGCFLIDTLTVTEPTLLESSVVGVNILCKGGDNGSVDLTVTGGTLPYAYAWNNGAVTEDINTLIAGYYEVNVLDGHGCPIMDSITLTEPLDSLEYTFTYEDVKCNDGTDGSIDLSITGGTTPYSYSWSNGATVPEILNLTSGWYEFVVTDFNGCIITDSMFIDQPDPLTLNEVITPVTCYGLTDGIIDISPLGGTTPYAYTWYNSMFALSAQTEDLNGYPADIYQLEIIDSNDCFYEMYFEIVQPDSLVIEYTFNVVSCNAGSDGNIFVDITGGNPAYTTVWSTGAVTEDLLNIPYGTYQLNVEDTKGCSDSIIVDIAQPTPVEMTIEHTPISCIDQADGVAFAFPYGGNGGYSYLWSNGETFSMNDELFNQWYYLTVTDILGCTGIDSVFITRDDTGCIDPVTAFTPNGDIYNDTWVIDNMYLYPEADLQIFNKWGNLVHQQIGIYEPWDGASNGAILPSGVYYWIINLNHPDREILKGNITIVK